MAEVYSLFIAFVHRQAVREVDSVNALADKGFEGCIHGRPGSKRQVLLIDKETLEELGIAAGAVKENVTTKGLDLSKVREGQRLRVGRAMLEVTGPCHPCDRMDEIRPGLQDALRSRRGILCRVLETGRVQRGDRIEVLDFGQVGS